MIESGDSSQQHAGAAPRAVLQPVQTPVLHRATSTTDDPARWSAASASMQQPGLRSVDCSARCRRASRGRWHLARQLLALDALCRPGGAPRCRRRQARPAAGSRHRRRASLRPGPARGSTGRLPASEEAPPRRRGVPVRQATGGLGDRLGDRRDCDRAGRSRTRVGTDDSRSTSRYSSELHVLRVPADQPLVWTSRSRARSEAAGHGTADSTVVLTHEGFEGSPCNTVD